MNNKEKLEYVTNNLSRLSFVEGVVLFGSQAQGKARQDSDWDIAVLAKKINRNQEAKVLGFSSENFDISLFNKLPLVVQFRVIRDGKVLYLKNKKLYHEIKYETIRHYLDFSFFINKF